MTETIAVRELLAELREKGVEIGCYIMVSPSQPITLAAVSELRHNGQAPSLLVMDSVMSKEICKWRTTPQRYFRDGLGNCGEIIQLAPEVFPADLYIVPYKRCLVPDTFIAVFRQAHNNADD